MAATSTYGLPSGSQQSSSDLSEPPDFTEEEIADFATTMAPRTRSLSGSKDNVSSSGQAESNGDSTLSHKQPVNDEPTTKKEENDEVLDEIQVARRSSRRRVPSKRTQVTFAEPASSAAPAYKRPKTSAKKWTPECVTQSKQSPLVGKDLRVSSPYEEPERTRFLTSKTRPYCYTLRRGMSSATRTRRSYLTFSRI